MPKKIVGKQVGVSVFARFRPCQGEKHIKQGEKITFEICDGKSINLSHYKSRSDKKDGVERGGLFHFDLALKDTTTQNEMFQNVGQAIVNDVLHGFNGTVFAYGQTGSGKTHSLFGDMTDPESKQRGIIPRACQQIFEHIQREEDIEEVTVKCSFIEIYLNKLKDLLNPKGGKLKIREKLDKTIFVQGVHEEYITSFQDLYDLLQIGFRNRMVAATKMNKASSRSHALLTLVIKQTMIDGTFKTSKLNFSDLAGSEKFKKSGATGDVLEQAIATNSSLSALGNVIHALTDSKIKHVPYRNSKLTHLLKDSLGGNSKTTLIVTCSSDAYNVYETITSLQFAARAKKIKNKITVNQKSSNVDLALLNDVYQKQLISANKTILKLNEFVNVMKKNSNSDQAINDQIDLYLKELMKSDTSNDNNSKKNTTMVRRVSQAVVQLDKVFEPKTEADLQRDSSLVKAEDELMVVVDNLKKTITAKDNQIDALNGELNALKKNGYSQKEQIQTVIRATN